MPLFKNPTPFPPGPKAKPNARREEGTINALGEAKSVLEKIWRFLAPFSPTPIRDIDGRRHIVLAADGGKGSSSLGLHPFQVVWKKTGVSNFECYIYEGALFNSLRPDDKVTITAPGLTFQSDLDAGSPNWRSMTLDDVIWLTVVFNGSGVVTSATINSLGESDTFNLDEDAWSGNDGYCEDDGGTPIPVHQTSRIVLAYSYNDGGSPVVVNTVSQNLVLKNSNIDGRAARYPQEFGGGYPI